MSILSSIRDAIASYSGRTAYGLKNIVSGFGRTPQIHINREGETVYEEMRVYAGISTLRHSPYHDNFTLETEEMRRLYRKWAAEPTVKAALAGKVYSVASLGLQVNPSDKKNPRSHEVADFVRHCLRRPMIGFPGLVYEIIMHAMMDGWSLCEPVWMVEDRGRFRGKRVMYDFKSKDTRYIIPRVDQFRNVIGYYNPRGNFNHLFDPGHLVAFTHLPVFRNPTGISDMRAAYRAMQMIPAIIKLRHIFLDKFTGPFIKGTVKDPALKAKMAAELAKARADGFIVLDPGSTVEVLDLVTRGTSDFQAGLDDLRKEAATAISGAFLHMMTAADPNARGDSTVQETNKDLFVWWLAEQVAVVIQHQLVPTIVEHAYGSLEDLPLVSLEAVSPADIKADLGIDQTLDQMGVDTSKEELLERARRSPPKDDNDSVQKAKAASQPKPQDGGGGIGVNPAGNGNPFQFAEPPAGHKIYILPDNFDLNLSRERFIDEAELQAFDSFAEDTKFSGTKKDRLGRTICYTSGKRVPCGTNADNPKQDAHPGPGNLPKTDGDTNPADNPAITGTATAEDKLGYNHKDVNHPVVKMIRSDTATAKLVEDFHSQFVVASKRQQLASIEYSQALAEANKMIDTNTGDYSGIKEKLSALAQAKSKATQELYSKIGEARDWLRENIKPDSPSTATVTIDGIHNDHAKPIGEGIDFAKSITGGVDKGIKVNSEGEDRAFYQEGKSTISMGGYAAQEAQNDDDAFVRNTAAHEFGHHIENTKAGLREKAHEFLDYRCGDESFVTMNSVAGGGYSEYEVGRKDNFDRVFDRPGNAYYVGKRYGQGKQFPTEVVAMGIEQLSRDPIKFAERDPEYFHWLITVLRS